MRLAQITAALALLLGLAGCAAVPPEMSSATQPVNPTTQFRALALQPGDGLTIDQRAATDTAFDITSERGIGKIEFERLGAAPTTLTFRLRLKGLEEFKLAWGDKTVTVHYPSSGGQHVTPDPADPLAMPVAIEATDPTIPLADGYFVLTAPPAFIQDAPERFTVQWIDFYR